MDQPQPRRSLSEISHLFLSSVRQRQTHGAPPPRRRPPQSSPTQPLRPQASAQPSIPPDISVDMTPDEFARMYASVTDAAEPGALPVAPVTVLIAAHLNGRQFDRCKELARHLAARGMRLGMIEVDASEFRLMRFACATQGDLERDTPEPPVICDQPRQMADAINELSFDVDQWLLVLPNPRTTEAGELLANTDRWTLLSTCDHDGVVSAYRMLKGLAEALLAAPFDVDASGCADAARNMPKLSLALLDAHDDADAESVSRKLAGVCQQFLGWPVDDGEVVKPVDQVVEHTVMVWRQSRGVALLGPGPQWQIVSTFLARAKSSPDAAQSVIEQPPDLDQEAAMADHQAELSPSPAPAFAHQVETSHSVPETAAAVPLPAAVAAPGKAMSPPDPMTAPALAGQPAAVSQTTASVTPQTGQPAATAAPEATRAASSTAPARPAYPVPVFTAEISRPEPSAGQDMSDVIELPDAQASEDAVLSAVMQRNAGKLVECPIRPPMCPQARLAVGRDRSLTLLAVARQGLVELRMIGRAYQWLIENRGLVAMAVPQMSIDAHRHPQLRLLVDHADRAAEALQPMLQSSAVSVESYRRLRWGDRTGLLLDAA